MDGQHPPFHLRLFKDSDEASIVRHANNPEVARFLRDIFPSPYTLEDAKWWIQLGSKVEGTLNRAIDVQGECVGSIGARFCDNEHRFSAEIGYWLGETFWGQGIMSSAVRQFTQFLFENYELKRIFAPVAHPNLPSIAVLKKCGYRLEGVFKQHMFLKGALFDEHIFAIYPQDCESS